MRLGLAGGLVPRRTDAVTAELAAQIAALGITGLHTHFQGDVFDFPAAECRRVRKVITDAGMRIVYNWGWQPPLLHPDEGVRKEAERTLTAAVEVAARLGAKAVLTGPGSVSPAGPWAPAEYNFGEEAFEQLVKSFRAAAKAAEGEGIAIVLEGHVLSAFNSCRKMLDLIEATGSTAIAVNYDPVNMVTHQNYYNTGSMMRQDAATLGPKLASMHAKDVVLRDRLVIHIDEAVPGRGNLDWDTLLRLADGAGQGFFVILEHLDGADVPEAAAFVQGRARSLGLRFEERD